MGAQRLLRRRWPCRRVGHGAKPQPIVGHAMLEGPLPFGIVKAPGSPTKRHTSLCWVGPRIADMLLD